MDLTKQDLDDKSGIFQFPISLNQGNLTQLEIDRNRNPPKDLENGLIDSRRIVPSKEAKKPHLH